MSSAGGGRPSAVRPGRHREPVAARAGLVRPARRDRNQAV